MTKKAGRELSSMIVPIMFGVLAIVIALLISWSGQYPYGSETMSFLYKGDVFYQEVKNGNLFPLYDSMWYNGVELFRYTAPIPVYFLALCQWIAGGDSFNGYLLFVGLLFFVGGLGWFYLGKKKNRVVLGTFLGVIWFFMPNNLYGLFMEGNLPRAVCMVILPFAISGIYDYITEGSWKDLLKVILAVFLMSFCDVEFVIMLAITIVVLGILYGIIFHQWKRFIVVVGGVLLGILMSSVWTLPHMIAVAKMSNAEIMQNYFQSIVMTINPFERYKTWNRYFYFGLAAALVAVFGILFSKKKTIPGFLVAVLILLSTSASMYGVMKFIPGKDYLLMGQYISLALGILLYCFLMWDTLKKPLVIVLSILLLADTVPSLNLVYGTLNGITLEERFGEQEETSLIKKAKEVSGQRIALLDGSELETMGAYLVSKYDDGKAASYGADWNAAATKSNLAQINRALSEGFYPYLFDRCLEMGNDTILIKMSQIDEYSAPVENMDAAAKEVGYELVDSNEFYRLYDMDVEGNWGTITEYPAIGIGTGASTIALGFPAVEEAATTNINDFTFEELSKYELIYLSGFTYEDKAKAEELIVKLSEAGVRIMILADGIPEDETSHTKGFLGITSNNISFSNGYPLLDTTIGVLDGEFFPSGYSEWSTVYVTGLDKIYGTVREDEVDLSFCGTVKNDNIVVMGLNLTNYYALTQDETIGRFIAEVMDFPTEKMPEREIVPLQIERENNSLTIVSEKENVNTSLAYHKMFESDRRLKEQNNLLYVNSGTTQITMEYLYYYPGLIASVLALVLAVVFVCGVRKKYGK